MCITEREKGSLFTNRDRLKNICKCLCMRKKERKKERKRERERERDRERWACERERWEKHLLISETAYSLTIYQVRRGPL